MLEAATSKTGKLNVCASPMEMGVPVCTIRFSSICSGTEISAKQIV